MPMPCSVKSIRRPEIGRRFFMCLCIVPPRDATKHRPQHPLHRQKLSHQEPVNDASPTEAKTRSATTRFRYLLVDHFDRLDGLECCASLAQASPGNQRALHSFPRPDSSRQRRPGSDSRRQDYRFLCKATRVAAKKTDSEAIGSIENTG